MKRNFTLLLAAMMLFTTITVHAATPTVPATNMNFSSIEGNSFSMSWVNGNGAKRLIIARKDAPVTALPVNGVDYIASNTFGLGNELSTGQFVVYDGTGNLASLSGLLPGTTYHLALFEYNGTGFTTEYLTTSILTINKSTIVAPSTQASAAVFSNITGNSLKLNWTNGNGAGRIVLLRAGSPVNVNPDNLAAYSASATFGLGDEIGSGNFVVSRGNSTNIVVTNLQPNVRYYVAIFEYNGNNGPVFLTTSPATGNELTAPRPFLAATNMSFSNIEGNSMSIAWVVGNGARRVVIAKAGSAVTAHPVDGAEYTANNNFGAGQEIAPGEFVIYAGASNFLSLKAIDNSTVYHFAVFEYDGTGSNTAYFVSSFLANSRSTQVSPAVAAQGISFSNIGSNSITLNWTNGDGANRIVIAKAGAPVNATPVNYTQYSSSTAFGSGTQLGTGNYVVYKGNANTTTVGNLVFNTTYHFAIFELNGSTAPVYLTVNPATGTVSTNNKPSTASTSLTTGTVEGNYLGFSWTQGNGARRIAVVRQGSPVDATPVDGETYTANSAFGSGTEISTGQFVAYNGTSSSFNLTNLSSGTTYYIAIFEFNGTGSGTSYLTSSFLAGQSTTLVAPTIQASALTFTNITGNSMQLNWVSGNGNKCLVLVKQGAAVNATPANFTNYPSSSSFGAGTQLGTGNYSAYNSTGNTITLTNLLPNTAYHVSIMEYNGNSAPVYLTTSPLIANHATAARPTAAASGIGYSSVEANSLALSWTNGNGSRRIVVAKAGSPVTGTPVDGVNYATSNTFGNGDQLNPGEYIIQNSTTTNMTLQGLSIGTTYHFAIFEYDGTGANTAYLVNTFATGNKSTVTIPTIQSATLLFTSVTNNSMTVNWSNGNGAQRIVIARKNNPVTAAPVNLVSYTQSASYGFGSNLGNDNFVVYKGNGASVNVTGLQSGTTYYFAVYEFNGSSAPAYLSTAPGTGNATTIGAPQTQATQVITAHISGTTAQINWTNGTGQKRLVLARKGSAVNADPADNINYTANTFFGSGQQVGAGNYVVFNGAFNSVTITNLEPQTIYHFAVYEYNDFGAVKMLLVTNPARGNSVTAVLPVTFIEFKGSTVANKVTLQWATATEIDADRFEIERSNDGANFTTQGWVRAAGNSNARVDYNHTDNVPGPGVYYYRLKQLDKDGRFQYSKTIIVTTKEDASFKILGNPIRNELVIALSDYQTKTTLVVRDMTGKTVIRQEVSNQSRVSLNTASITAGIYNLEVITGKEKGQVQFIKLN